MSTTISTSPVNINFSVGVDVMINRSVFKHDAEASILSDYADCYTHFRIIQVFTHWSLEETETGHPGFNPQREQPFYRLAYVENGITLDETLPYCVYADELSFYVERSYPFYAEDIVKNMKELKEEYSHDESFVSYIDLCLKVCKGLEDVQQVEANLLSVENYTYAGKRVNVSLFSPSYRKLLFEKIWHSELKYLCTKGNTLIITRSDWVYGKGRSRVFVPKIRENELQHLFEITFYIAKALDYKIITKKLGAYEQKLVEYNSFSNYQKEIVQKLGLLLYNDASTFKSQVVY